MARTTEKEKVKPLKKQKLIPHRNTIVSYISMDVKSRIKQIVDNAKRKATVGRLTRMQRKMLKLIFTKA